MYRHKNDYNLKNGIIKALHLCYIVSAELMKTERNISHSLFELASIRSEKMVLCLKYSIQHP